MKKFSKLIFVWVLFTFIFFSIACLTYAVGQQILRLGANDQQMQLVDGLNNAVKNGQDISSYFGNDSLDVSKSLYPFVIQYDTNYKVVASDGQLNSKTPELPQGVLETASKDYMKTFTWQPKDGVRIAAVVIKNDKGYILSGKSLNETERRITRLEKIVLGWFAGVEVGTIALLAIYYWLFVREKKEKQAKEKKQKSVKIVEPKTGEPATEEKK